MGREAVTEYLAIQGVADAAPDAEDDDLCYPVYWDFLIPVDGKLMKEVELASSYNLYHACA